MTRALPTLRKAIALMLFGVLPVCAVGLTFANARGSGIVTDFENAFYPAAEAVLDGSSPYPDAADPRLADGTEYVYPPLTALATTPFTAIPIGMAGFVVMAFLVIAVLATLWILGIRDWRCYGLAFLWPPVIASIQTGNVTIPLVLGAACIWRWRDRRWVAGGALGMTLAIKLFLWPLALWLGFTKRLPAAAIAVAVGTVALLTSWAVIGFAGIGQYPDLLRRIQELEEGDSYTIYALALDLGFADGVARALWAGAAVSLVAAVAVIGYYGDERRAFVIAVAAALACSPIVWLHYFALLLVVVGVVERRMGPAWFAPLVMYGSSGTLNGTTLQTALTLAAAALTVTLAMRPAWPTRPAVYSTDSPVGGRPW